MVIWYWLIKKQPVIDESIHEHYKWLLYLYPGLLWWALVYSKLYIKRLECSINWWRLWHHYQKTWDKVALKRTAVACIIGWRSQVAVDWLHLIPGQKHGLLAINNSTTACNPVMISISRRRPHLPWLGGDPGWFVDITRHGHASNCAVIVAAMSRLGTCSCWGLQVNSQRQDTARQQQNCQWWSTIFHDRSWSLRMIHNGWEWLNGKCWFHGEAWSWIIGSNNMFCPITPPFCKSWSLSGKHQIFGDSFICWLDRHFLGKMVSADLGTQPLAWEVDVLANHLL